jgi:hydrogenase expression/formation protein HypD
MKYVDEFRDEALCRRYAENITRKITRPWRIMEVCGGQTHAIVRFGIDKLLPANVTLLHGPGCPVCVTPVEMLDRALAIAARPNIIFCSFGDMLRVPGSEGDLFSVKSAGADVRMVYSPLDALEIAQKNPGREVVFFAVGFETTAPAHAMAIKEAARRELRNFSLLVSHVLVPPALEAILGASERRVDAFLAAGHVCAIMGLDEYRPLVEKHQVPIVVTGFEPADILQGISMCIAQLEEGRAELENQYTRAVRPDGNMTARRVVGEVFQVVPRKWRGIGDIPLSGLGLCEAYAFFDAEKRFAVGQMVVHENSDCKSGLVLQGILKPSDCPAFGVKCTPEKPLGATMVSAEGACAAYYRYRRAGLS